MPEVRRDQLTVSGPIPAGRYTVGILDVDPKPSKKGNPMAALTLQILSPESVPDATGKPVKTVGRTFKEWITFAGSLRSVENAETILGDTAVGGVLEGGTFGEVVNTDNIPLQLLQHGKGRIMPNVELVAEQAFKVDPATKEPVYENGQKVPVGYNIRVKKFAQAFDPSLLGMAELPPAPQKA